MLRLRCYEFDCFSEDLSFTAGGFLSRSGSVENLLSEADSDQVQSALSRVGDVVAKDRMELTELKGTLLQDSQSQCHHITELLQTVLKSKPSNDDVPFLKRVSV